MRARLRAELLQAEVSAPTMLTMEDIVALTRTHRSTIHRAVAQGSFPRPIMELGVRSHRWLTADYLAWVDEQKAKQGTDAPRVKAHRP